MNKYIYLFLSLIIFLLIFFIFTQLQKDKSELSDESNENNNTNTKNPKIAFLFLTTDMIHGSDIWKAFFLGHENQYNIYINPKYPQLYTDPFWKAKIVQDPVLDTKWGTISLVTATLHLLSTAYHDDPLNYKFVLVCDKSLPIKTFDYIYQTLTQNDKSWFNYYEPQIHNHNHYKKIFHIKGGKDLLKDGHFLHQEQWMILNRSHTRNILKHKKWAKNFSHKVFICGDEIFFISLLSKILGRQRLKEELQFPQATDYWDFKKHDKIMWAKWFTDASFHPKTYNLINDDVTMDLLRELQLSNCLFARKFSSLKRDLTQDWIQYFLLPKTTTTTNPNQNIDSDDNKDKISHLD